jgi:hypothetical protein
MVNFQFVAWKHLAADLALEAVPFDDLLPILPGDWFASKSANKSLFVESASSYRV